MPREVVPIEMRFSITRCQGNKHVRTIADAQLAGNIDAGGFERIRLGESAAGSMTRPLPMTARFPGCRMPLGISFRTNLRSPIRIVWPALWPPW